MKTNKTITKIMQASTVCLIALLSMTGCEKKNVQEYNRDVAFDSIYTTGQIHIIEKDGYKFAVCITWKGVSMVQLKE